VVAVQWPLPLLEIAVRWPLLLLVIAVRWLLLAALPHLCLWKRRRRWGMRVCAMPASSAAASRQQSD